ncbi:hypothetical protein EDD18DRAFT_1339267 [Armillaria luteobubalina]|uniref:Uncharacterized protein n=1 Tax=Armillaria luteobubalina TaxID=153913 RepID=A0AA39NYX6_9AGAR|nr:hypothetical protein EDD18DRAFT_1339267 [Armillaria luteobubalina]
MSSIAFLIYDIIITLHKEVPDLYFCTIDETLNARMDLPENDVSIRQILWSIVYHLPEVVLGQDFVRVVLPVHTKLSWLYRLGEILFATVVNVILVMRLNAMYRKNVKVLVFLVFLVVVEFVLELYCSLVSANKSYETTFSAPLGLPWPGCFAKPNVVFTLTAWIPTTLIASRPVSACLLASVPGSDAAGTISIFFLMTMAKLFEDGRSKLSQIRIMSQVSPRLVSFFQDGGVFFFLIFAVLVASTVMNVLATGILGEILGCWLIAVYSFAACRLTINLREAAEHGNASTCLRESMCLTTWQGNLVLPETSGSTTE